VPATSGTPVNHPWLTVSGLSGLVTGNAGQWLLLSGGLSQNTGLFPIVNVLSSTSCVIANPFGTSPDAGPLAWTIYQYPYIGPSMPWGAPNSPAFGSGTFGLNVSTQVVESIRQILKRWKSAATYYPHIAVTFSGGSGTAGSALSPLSAQGSGNPDGTYGPPGQIVNGVAVPTRFYLSHYDCWCDGTGSYAQCAVRNVT